MALSVEYKKVVKTGGCFRVSIPPNMRKALNLRLGDYLKIEVEQDRLVMQKASPEFSDRRIK